MPQFLESGIDKLIIKLARLLVRQMVMQNRIKQLAQRSCHEWNLARFHSLNTLSSSLQSVIADHQRSIFHNQCLGNVAQCIDQRWLHWRTRRLVSIDCLIEQNFSSLISHIVWAYRFYNCCDATINS